MFNGEQYVELAIQSLLAQTYSDFELIISDNASTDGTLEVCHEYARVDHRVRVMSTPENHGAANNYNRVFRAGTGRYFKWAAHDDVCHPSLLERCVDALGDVNPRAVLAYPRAEFVDARGSRIRQDTDSMATSDSDPVRRLAHAIRTVNMANPVFGLIRRDALARTRLIGPFIASDYVLLAELALLGAFVEVPEVLLQRRLHPDSSREANRSPREVAAWFDPASADAPSNVHLRLMTEYARSAAALTSSRSQRWKCYGVIPTTYTYRRARVWGGRIRRRFHLREASEDWVER